MKRNKIIMAITLFMALLCFCGCIKLPEDPTEPTDSTTTGTIVPPERIDPILQCYQTTVYTYTSQVDQSLLTTGQSSKYLLLANKKNELGAAYLPSSLSTLTCRIYGDDRDLQLESRAAAALQEMLDEMEAEGIVDVSVTSAYRDYQYQQGLFNVFVEKEMERITEEAVRFFGEDYIKTNYTDCGLGGLSEADAIKVVASYSARAGQSEHQTGLCVDLITSTMNGHLTEAFENTEAFAWLSKNAYKFGFILRYPKGKESVTGYTYEPWHYRFVGREAATNIHFSGLVLEEYLIISAGK